jgi:hypothetical protein
LNAIPNANIYDAFFNILNQYVPFLYTLLSTLPHQIIIEILESLDNFDEIIASLRIVTQANPNSNIYSNHFLSLNNPFILFKPEIKNYQNNDFSNLPNIFTHEERLSYYTNNLNVMMYNNQLLNNDYNFRLFTPGNAPALTPINPDLDLNNFPQPNPYNILYLPEGNKIINIQIISSIYHEKVFKQLLAFDNPIYKRIKDDFIAKNQNITPEQIDKLLFKILDDAIKNNLSELVNITLFFTASRLVEEKLLNIPGNIYSKRRTIFRDYMVKT